MRDISTLELALVSGGSLWEDILEFFSTDGGGNSSPSVGGTQTVRISATRMSDAERFAYDVEKIRSSLPDCQITFTITGGSGGGTITVGAEKGIPNASVGGNLNYQRPTTVYTCPPKSGITQNPSD